MEQGRGEARVTASPELRTRAVPAADRVQGAGVGAVPRAARAKDLAEVPVWAWAGNVSARNAEKNSPTSRACHA